MKRSAVHQLTKDGRDEEDDDSEGQVGFQKADDTILATRVIRGLPKRNSAASSSTSSSSSQPDQSSSKFGAFKGFNTGSSSTFTFTPPAATPSMSPSQDPPLVAPTASSTAKALSSFLSSPSQNSLAPASTQSSPDEIAAETYWKSLRGLNVAFISAVQQAMEGDPFVDLNDTFVETYQRHREVIQRQFDNASQTDSSSPAPLSRTPTQAALAMPTPPSSSSSFSGFTFSQKSTSGSSESQGTGFTPGLTNGASSKTTASPFNFASSTSTVSASTSSSFFNPSSSGTSSAFSFGKPATSMTSTSPSKDSESSTPGSKSDTAKSSGFSFGAPATSASPFGSASFGAPPSSSKPNPFGAPSVPSSFPSSTPSSSSTSTAPKPASPFGGFGTGPASAFGAKTPTSPGGGSIGNPVGFGFGAAANNNKDKDSSNNATGSVLAFGSPAPKPLEEQHTAEIKAGGEGEEKKEGGLEAAALFGNSPHDEEGEGEEDEETTHSIRLKAFRLKKADEGAAGWAELGTGLLRLKKHKQTGARRVLLRNSSTGKVIINFNLYGGLNPSQTKKTVMFVGHEGETSQTYNVRMKTEEQAAELKNALEREITFVKAKSDA
ncbi:hypothetical protein D9758_001823 [Tetrapyrgos nigripes]|uniref:RanBD1 domain-containing protein n=1 Tax=Tetrapyrgos nigripes TaxID=182062 RepID=A0A8H5GT18_9AGAR|nr:hypothetical protein D9758_001823 [Tetrapyrgos nigripes]